MTHSLGYDQYFSARLAKTLLTGIGHFDLCCSILVTPLLTIAVAQSISSFVLRNRHPECLHYTSRY